MISNELNNPVIMIRTINQECKQCDRTIECKQCGLTIECKQCDLTIECKQCDLTIECKQCDRTIECKQCDLTIECKQCGLTIECKQCDFTIECKQCDLTIECKQCELTIDLLWRGCPSKLSEWASTFICHTVIQNPFIMLEELQKDLQAAGKKVSWDKISWTRYYVELHSLSVRKNRHLKSNLVKSHQIFAHKEHASF